MNKEFLNPIGLRINEESKKIIRRLNTLKNKFKKSITGLQDTFTPENNPDHFYSRNDRDIFFLKKSGALNILQQQDKRVIHFPDPHTHKMGGDGNSICYVTYLVDDKLMGLVMEYSLLTEKSEYEVLKFMAYGEGRGACQFREGGGNGPLNRSIKMAEGRGMVDAVLNSYYLPYSQDEEYIQNITENGRKDTSCITQEDSRYIPESDSQKINEEQKKEVQQITSESKDLFKKCMAIINYRHGNDAMFTEQDAMEKKSEINSSVMDVTIMRRIYKSLEQEKSQFIEMIGSNPTQPENQKQSC